MSTTKQRPPQVTMAAGMVIGGSVLVVLGVFEQLGSLRSLESREGIERFLSQPPGNGLGLDVEGVISILHVTAMVAAGCATAAAILGWHVLKRDLKARVALSILAVPLFVSGLVTGGFISSLVAASVVVLWMPPAREWFRTGSWTPPAPRPKQQPEAGPTDQPNPWHVPHQHGQSTQHGEPTHDGQPERDHQGPPAQQTPYGMPHPTGPRVDRPVGPHAAARPAERPRPLVLAFALSVGFAVLTVLMAGLSTVAMLVAPELVMEELTRQRPEIADQGVTPDLLRATTLVLGGMVVAWSIGAIVLASLAFLGREWARLGLMISAIATVAACLLMAFGAPVLLLPAAAALVTVLNLRKPEVREWCARPAGRQPGQRDGMWP